MERDEMQKKVDLRSCLVCDLENMAVRAGEKKFRGRQVFQWVHRHFSEKIQDMKNVNKDFLSHLEKTAYLRPLELLAKESAKEDSTEKFLFGLRDGQAVETVLMHYRYGASICVSTQVGCRMGCAFCASTIGGLIKNLSAGEMAGQVIDVHRLAPLEERAYSIVVMGSGEPLENYHETIKFIRIINDPMGLGIGWRRITVSTCGLVPAIYRLAEEQIPINLAVSLHASNDRMRDRLMPINQKYPLEELLAACRSFIAKTGRRITFEYVMIKGLNDSREAAFELAEKLRGLLCHVNLIPVNPIKEKPYQRPSLKQIDEFSSILSDRGLEVTIRRELGQDVEAACGQLRSRFADRARMGADRIEGKAGEKDD